MFLWLYYALHCWLLMSVWLDLVLYGLLIGHCMFVVCVLWLLSYVLFLTDWCVVWLISYKSYDWFMCWMVDIFGVWLCCVLWLISCVVYDCIMCVMVDFWRVLWLAYALYACCLWCLIIVSCAFMVDFILLL